MSQVVVTRKELKEIPDSYHLENETTWIKSEKFTQTKLF